MTELLRNQPENSNNSSIYGSENYFLGYCLTGESLVEEGIIGYSFRAPHEPIEHIIGTRTVVRMDYRNCIMTIIQPTTPDPSGKIERHDYNWITNPYTPIRIDANPSLT